MALMMSRMLSGFYCPLLRQRTMISISSSLQKTSLCTWTAKEQITAMAITLKCRLCLSCTIDPSKFTSAQVSVGFSHLLLCFRTYVCVCMRARMCVCVLNFFLHWWHWFWECFRFLDPINTFHSSYQTDNEPIRLSYHRSVHYNSVVDPYKATIGVGLGLPGLQPGVIIIPAMVLVVLLLLMLRLLMLILLILSLILIMRMLFCSSRVQMMRHFFNWWFPKSCKH